MYMPIFVFGCKYSECLKNVYMSTDGEITYVINFFFPETEKIQNFMEYVS